MRRLIIISCCVTLLAASLPSHFDTKLEAQELKTKECLQNVDSNVAAQIPQWIVLLGSDSFHVREQAQKDLIQSGKVSIRYLVNDFSSSKDQERARRILQILEALSENDEPSTYHAAEHALKEILSSDDLNRMKGRQSAAAFEQWIRTNGVDVEYNALGEIKSICSYSSLPIPRMAIDHLRELGSLTCIHLSGAAVTDENLHKIASMKQLYSLFLTNTKTSDDGIACFKDHPSLGRLYLCGTNITDNGLIYLKGMAKLEHLDLSNTIVTDAGVAHLRAVQSLRYLDLSNTQITDAGVNDLNELNSLDYLLLSNTKVSDVALHHLKANKSLSRLYLDGTQITDRGLEQLNQIRSLRYLILNNTNITDAGVTNLSDLKSLISLYLSDTRITDKWHEVYGESFTRV